jgi:hypothetical protein
MQNIFESKNGFYDYNVAHFFYIVKYKKISVE